MNEEGNFELKEHRFTKEPEEIITEFEPNFFWRDLVNMHKILEEIDRHV